MKRLLALILAFSLILSGCNIQASETKEPDSTTTIEDTMQEYTELSDEEIESQFKSLNDPALLQYVEDSMYQSMTLEFNSDDYIVEDVSAIYISKEYIEELEYNSQENVFFGYTLDEVSKQFDRGKYVFTLADDGTTAVQPFENYDDTYEKVLKNVAIGTGVILVCVTVSVVTAGVGMPAVSMVFAASAKTGATMALSSGGMGVATAGIVTAIQTGDVEQAIDAAALAGSEAFKWGAISGVVAGGVEKVVTMKKAATATNTVCTPRESEIYVLKKYKGTEQVSYIDGIEVPMSTPGATRPDVVRMVGDKLEAIEVKNYNLESSNSRSVLYNELKRQVTSRVKNLPEGSTQRIVLDTRGRGFLDELVESVIARIHETLDDVYPNIPIDILT